MKIFGIITSALIILSSCGAPSIDNTKFGEANISDQDKSEYVVDIQNSQVFWIGRKPTGSHDGYVNLNSGSFQTENGKLNGGKFILDMTSITCTDIEDEEEAIDLADHLKDEDFFETNNFPLAEFEITNAELENEKYTIKGKLTIKDITNEISFYSDLTAGNDTLVALSEFSIDRTLWNVKYKSKSILGDVGDKFIYDDIDLKIKLIATKK